ncbi:MAG: cytochrome c [Rhodospirillaceae bacterium]
MTARRLTLAVLAVIAAAVMSSAGWDRFKESRAAEAAVVLTPHDAAVVARGKDVYRDQCAQCHGANLEGEAGWREPLPNGRMKAPPHDASGHTWHHADAVLFKITKYGPAKVVGGGYQSNMPGFVEQVSDADIVAVLSYIKSTWPDRIKQRHDKINERANGAK